VEQITLRELLRDPIYRKWLAKKPKIRVVHSTPPWRLYVQKEQGGKWARVDIPGYAKAYGAVSSKLSEYYDMALSCKPQAFRPPIVRVGKKRYYYPSPPGHRWCGYCRRPTIFKRFTKHHAHKGRILPDYEVYCSICGARGAGQKQYKSTLTWPPEGELDL